MKRDKTIVAHVDEATRARLERQRVEYERRTGVKPSISTMAAMLINQALSGRRAAAS